jgi:hypothetical protein
MSRQHYKPSPQIFPSCLSVVLSNLVFGTLKTGGLKTKKKKTDVSSTKKQKHEKPKISDLPAEKIPISP